MTDKTIEQLEDELDAAEKAAVAARDAYNKKLREILREERGG